jgi:hypothetical protein
LGDECMNPYCSSANPTIHSPSSEDYCLFKSELNVNNWDLLDTGKIKLMVCKDCGAWTAEVWDQKKLEYLRQWACMPFRFNLGDKVSVILRGKDFNRVGTVAKRTRTIKPVYPLPAPENYYDVFLEKSQSEEVFNEENLEPCC